jgi:antitoxin CcdA
MRMHDFYSPNAPKKPTNLSINSDLLQKARALDVNLSSVLEQALVETLRNRMSEQWLSENQDAIEAYNEQVEAEGVFGDGVRTF